MTAQRQRCLSSSSAEITAPRCAPTDNAANLPAIADAKLKSGPIKVTLALALTAVIAIGAVTLRRHWGFVSALEFAHLQQRQTQVIAIPAELREDIELSYFLRPSPLPFFDPDVALVVGGFVPSDAVRTELEQLVSDACVQRPELACAGRLNVGTCTVRVNPFAIQKQFCLWTELYVRVR